MSGTARLTAALRAEGGLLAAALRAPADPNVDSAGGGSTPAASVSSRAGEDPPPAPATNAGPADEPLLAEIPDGPYALTLAAVREGYLLHYGEGRVLDAPDPDLALLGGDRLYALALAELAALGDLSAVVTLADLISACARTHAEDDPAQARVAWEAAVAAIGRAA
jgi:hypothetical protein